MKRNEHIIQSQDKGNLSNRECTGKCFKHGGIVVALSVALTAVGLLGFMSTLPY